MIFRGLFAASYLIVLLNIAQVFGIDKANPIERSVLLAAGIAFVLTRPRRPLILLVMVLMIVVTLIGALGTSYSGFDWPTYLRGLTQILIPFLLMAGIPTQKDRDFMLRVTAWAPIASVALGLLYQLAGRWTVWHADELGVARLQGSLMAAFLAAFCLAGTYAAMQYAAQRNRLYIVVCAIDAAILLLTASRMPLALAVLMCGFIFFRRFKVNGFAKVGLVAVAALALVAFIGLSDKSVLARFQSNTLTGRELMWPLLESQLDQNPVFGVGFAHEVTLVPHAVQIMTGSPAAHNDYLRIAVELGYPGAILFLILLVTALLGLWASPTIRRDPVMLLGSACFFLFALTDNAFGTTADVLFLVILPVGCGLPVARAAAGRIRPPGIQGPTPVRVPLVGQAALGEERLPYGRIRRAAPHGALPAPAET